MPAGRPRSEAARNAILAATRDELTRNGYSRLSIDRIAAAAGVGKQTVYRWYASKSVLVADCLLQGYVMAPAVALQERGSVQDDILDWMQGFREMTRNPESVALIRAASAAAAEDPQIARGFQEQMNTLAREALVARIRAAESAGEIRANSPAATIAEIIVGSIIYRLFTHEEITASFIEELSTVIFRGLQP
ncbi:TetR/AcrR family transcriptional regulator [Pseudarthrobacter polychromogenes]|nr:TetR/AcrR family transcriptional regulator [Pseudarthrobacter polychromogenes]